MEHLTPKEARRREREIREELAELMAAKAVVTKPSSLQWRFFAACIERLLNPKKRSEFERTPAVQVAQWKFETEGKLKRYYQRPGRPIAFVFSLVHKDKLAEHGIMDIKEQPMLCGYCVLVRDLAGPEDKDTFNRDVLRPYLERVVTECVDAEFMAYTALPEINAEAIDRWFVKNSPAWKEIMGVLTRQRDSGWVLTNPFNPSTKRILSLSVKKIERKEAVVHTTEYWYLRWWDVKKKKYTYAYRETNRQVYILQRDGDQWKIFQNLRPLPRSSAEFRNARRK